MEKKKYYKPLKSWSDRKIFPLTEERFEKVGSKWVKRSSETKTVSEQYYHNVFDKDTLKFFRSLGGYEKNDITATYKGYVPYKNTSISPDRSVKVVRTVDFRKAKKNSDRQYDIYSKAISRRHGY